MKLVAVEIPEIDLVLRDRRTEEGTGELKDKESDVRTEGRRDGRMEGGRTD